MRVDGAFQPVRRHQPQRHARAGDHREDGLGCAQALVVGDRQQRAERGVGQCDAAHQHHHLQREDGGCIAAAVGELDDRPGPEVAHAGQQQAEKVEVAHRIAAEPVDALLAAGAIGVGQHRHQHRHQAGGQQIHPAACQRGGDGEEADRLGADQAVEQIGLDRLVAEGGHQRRDHGPGEMRLDAGQQLVVDLARALADLGAAQLVGGHQRMRDRDRQEQQHVAVQRCAQQRHDAGAGQVDQAQQADRTGLDAEAAVALGHRDAEQVPGLGEGGQQGDRGEQRQMAFPAGRTQCRQRGQEDGAHRQQRPALPALQPAVHVLGVDQALAPERLGDEADRRGGQAMVHHQHQQAREPHQIGVAAVVGRPEAARDQHAGHQTGRVGHIGRAGRQQH